MKKKLLLATTNPGKLREMKSLLSDLPYELVTPTMLGFELSVEENGETYATNAEIKARAYAHRSGLLTLADDSGLEVEALNGSPGLHSARYSPIPGASDADRRAYLLHNLRSHPQPWKARFRCVVAIASASDEIYFSEGICPGMIIAEERGENGFGYDPIFYLPELGKTMAELSEEKKNELSHRARAVKAAIPVLLKLHN